MQDEREKNDKNVRATLAYVWIRAIRGLLVSGLLDIVPLVLRSLFHMFIRAAKIVALDHNLVLDPLPVVYRPKEQLRRSGIPGVH